MNAPTFTSAGGKATTAAKLDKTVFEVEAKNHELLKQAYLAHDANQRQNIAVTKTRGLVSGGGKKPWKQKGTGRARFGSSRVPIWRGGGVVFGPTGNENYAIKLHAAAKRTALRQALSLKAAEGKVVVIEDISFKNNKTAEAAKLLATLKATGNVIVAVDVKTPEVLRSFANLQNVTVNNAAYLSVYNTLNADMIIVTSKALAVLHDRLKTADKGDK
jgi:large subunit ribosomal protein L4